MLCDDAKFIVPFFAEAADKGFAEELVEADAAFCAEADGILADVPAMIVQACERPKLLLADGIKMATDRLLPQKTAV